MSAAPTGTVDQLGGDRQTTRDSASAHKKVAFSRRPDGVFSLIY